MSKSIDFLVFIGRFQPFHTGHLSVVQRALTLSDRVILVCGSARQPRSIRNPWPPEQIADWIRACLEPSERDRVDIEPVMDVPYNERLWVRAVQQATDAVIARRGIDTNEARIGLIGLTDNGASYFPSRFPYWYSVPFDTDNGVRGTAIREALFDLGEQEDPGGVDYLTSAAARAVLPEPIRVALLSWCDTDAYAQLHQEAAFLADYRGAWANAPYPPTFVTVDAIVVQSGHILLVERRARPGRGLLALPGGFIGPGEWLEDACIRVLRTETRLKVPAPVLKGSIQGRRVFDAPHRSQRGRTITHGFLIELAPAPVLPRVKGGDGTRQAFWLPLNRLEPEYFFEDHYFMIQTMLG